MARRCRRYKHWKKKYASEQAAEQAARAMAERFGEVYRAYHCQPGCGSWHVGRPHDDASDRRGETRQP